MFNIFIAGGLFFGGFAMAADGRPWAATIAFVMSGLNLWVVLG